MVSVKNDNKLYIIKMMFEFEYILYILNILYNLIAYFTFYLLSKTSDNKKTNKMNIQNIQNIQNIIPTISIPSPPLPMKHSKNSKNSKIAIDSNMSSSSTSSTSSTEFDWPETFGIHTLLEKYDCPFDILDVIFPELITGRIKRGELRKLKQKSFDVINEVNEYLKNFKDTKNNIANSILSIMADLQGKIKRVMKKCAISSLHRRLNAYQPTLNNM